MYNSQRRSTKLTRQLRNQSGAWLCELRKKRGLSQRELAKRVGAGYYTVISQLEAGWGRIPADRYQVWADALGVEPREFVRTLMSYSDPDYDPVTSDVFPNGSQSGPRTAHIGRPGLPSPNIDEGPRQRLATK